MTILFNNVSGVAANGDSTDTVEGKGSEPIIVIIATAFGLGDVTLKVKDTNDTEARATAVSGFTALTANKIASLGFPLKPGLELSATIASANVATINVLVDVIG